MIFYLQYFTHYDKIMKKDVENMHINRDKLAATFNTMQENLREYSLPLWDALPDIELYMDQVISILGKYLAIYYETIGAEKWITSSMINNYVKLGIIPAPVKKKYSKTHLAYLLILCTLKQTLDMATIQKIIPVDLETEEVMKTYNAFVENQRKAYQYVTENIRVVAEPILNQTESNEKRINDLLMQVAASANIFKILTEKMTKIEQ